MDSRQILPGFLLLLLAAGSWWLAQNPYLGIAINSSGERTPDYYVNHFTVTTLNAAGQPFRRLVAEQMRHYDQDESAELNQPILTLFEGSDPPWRVESETGWVNDEGDLALLHGRVTIDREAAEGIRPVHIVTKELTVKPKEKYAETDQPVEAHSQQDWMTSVGAQIWFEEPMKMNLLSRVRAHYAVN